MTLFCKRAIAGQVPRSDGLLNVFEFVSGEVWTIKWDVQTNTLWAVRYKLTAAPDNNSRDDQKNAHYLSHSERFVKEDRTQHQDKDKGQTHKRVRVAQFKLRHRCQPADKRTKARADAAQDPGVEDQAKQEWNSFCQTRGQRTCFRDLPLHYDLTVHGE